MNESNESGTNSIFKNQYFCDVISPHIPMISWLQISSLTNRNFFKTIGIHFYSKQFCDKKENVTIARTANSVTSYIGKAVNYFISALCTLHLLHEQHQDDN